RISKVLTSSTIGASYPVPQALDAFWTAPADRQALRSAMARMVHDRASLTDAMLDDRWKLLTSGDYAQYFSAMFARPRQRYIDAAVLSDAECQAIRAKVVRLHGRSDQPCPAELTTLAIAKKLPQADVQLLGNCGHNLPRERTADYIAAALKLFAP